MDASVLFSRQPYEIFFPPVILLHLSNLNERNSIDKEGEIDDESKTKETALICSNKKQVNS
jgi:hypothetical protein